MNRKTLEVANPDLDYDSDEPEGHDRPISEGDRPLSEDERSPVDNLSDGSSASGENIGLSLDEIIEGDDNEDAEALKSPSVKETKGKTNLAQLVVKKVEITERLKASEVFIKTMVYGIIISAWGLTVFFFNNPLFNGRYQSETIISFFVFMSTICYYRCTNVKNLNPTEFPPRNVRSDNKNNCKLCCKWKPERSHHCRQCGHCVLRMDHHCTWICNCIGYKNHKAFTLFCFYAGLGSFYFDYRALYFYFSTLSDYTIYQYPAYFLIYSLLCLFIICPIGLFVFGLGLYHFILAMNDMTTVESLTGPAILMPWDDRELIGGKLANKYNRGFGVNLINFFGANKYLWLWPTIPSVLFEGQQFEQVDLDSEGYIKTAKVTITKDPSLDYYDNEEVTTGDENVDVSGFIQMAEDVHRKNSEIIVKERWLDPDVQDDDTAVHKRDN